MICTCSPNPSGWVDLDCRAHDVDLTARLEAPNIPNPETLMSKSTFTCLRCPEGDNQLPAYAVFDHIRIAHPDAYAEGEGFKNFPHGSRVVLESPDLPTIELVPFEGRWIWECRVGSRRCHTGSIFEHAGSAAEVAAHHIATQHPDAESS